MGNVLNDGQGRIVETEIDKSITDKINNKFNELDVQITNLVKVKTNISILSVNWIDDTSTSGYWYYDVSDADIDENTVVDVNFNLASLDGASDIKSRSDSFVGYVRIYADAQPTLDLIADLKLIKGMG